MASSADLAEQPVSVALIGRKDEARGQLQTALTEFGAEVVFEGEPPDIDVAALRRTAPSVVIVNLDAAVEDALDSLQAVFDDPDVNVVFNEADVTRQLGGWDLARWARHLAAKVLGHGDTNPPAPVDAERLPGQDYMPGPGAPPTPEQMAGERMIEEFTVEADDHADAIPTDYLPMQVDLPAHGDAGAAMDFDVDMDAIEGAMSTADARPEVAATAVPDSPPAGHEDAAIDFGVDLSVLDAALGGSAAAAQPSTHTSTDEAALLDEALGDFALDLGDEADDEADSAPTSFARFAAGQDEGELQIDESVAQLAAQLDELAVSAPSPVDDSGPEFDFALASDEPSAPAPEHDALELEPAIGDEDDHEDATAAAAATEAAPAAAGGFDFGALELAPMDGGDGSAPAVAPPTAPSAAPAADNAGFDFGSLELSLEPIDEAADGDAAAHDGAAIQRVVVLGASIGGPDALRSFLGGIPAGFPALFVLAQHLDNGFFERLAQQLQKSSKLPVRVAQPGEPAAHGQVLVVPSDARIAIEPDGSVVSEAHGEAPRYRPCIDDVMRDIADRFGARATAIVFSGMAGDAIEGSVYLTSRGGEVWAQRPDSCVVSSMVDGACARGVVEFTGTPRELADQCVARYGG